MNAPTWRSRLADVFSLFKETFDEWNEDKAPRLGAALAFYTVFSLAPLLIIVIAIAGMFLGVEAAQGKIDEQIRGLVGPQGADLIQAMIASARKPQEGILATLIGLSTLVVGGLGAFGQLQEALNTIWEVTPKPGRGIKGVIEDRFASSTLVLGVGFLLLVSLVISALLSAVGNWVSGFLVDFAILAQILNTVLSFGVITLLFALIFKYLPDVEIAWRDVWVGALITSFLFTVGKFLIGLYLGSGSVGSAYGAAGSLIILLLWVYYSTQILFFGAEFTQAYANRFGSKIKPAKNALPITEEARAQQGIPHSAQVEALAASPPTPPEAVAIPLSLAHGSATRPMSAAQRPAHPLTLPKRSFAAYFTPMLGFTAGFGAGIFIAVAQLLGKQLGKHHT